MAVKEAVSGRPPFFITVDRWDSTCPRFLQGSYLVLTPNQPASSSRDLFRLRGRCVRATRGCLVECGAVL